MVVVGANLKALIAQMSVCNNTDRYDEFSITLTLSKHMASYCPHRSESDTINYSDSLSEEMINRWTIEESGYTLTPGDCVLACSDEIIKMPEGYIGFIQTKGSLARLFIMIHCCDSQVEPGFEGAITFEIVNVGKNNVRIHAGDEVAQLFVFQASSKNTPLYRGKYQGSDVPTHYRKT